MFFRRILNPHMMLLFLLAFYAGPYNSVRATLEGWRTPIRAEIAAEYKDSTNLARQQQAQEAERGQHLSAEDKLVWARERFRADCAARAIRTSEDAEWHYTRIRDARSAVVRAHSI